MEDLLNQDHLCITNSLNVKLAALVPPLGTMPRAYPVQQVDMNPPWTVVPPESDVGHNASGEERDTWSITL